MPAERNPLTDYAPSNIGNEVSSRAQSVISSVLENADIEGRRQLTTGICGEVNVFGKTVPYNLSASSKDGSMVATLGLLDEKGRSAKVSEIEFIVTPRTKLVKPEGSWLRRVLSAGEYAFAIETNIGRGTRLTYAAGRTADDPPNSIAFQDIQKKRCAQYEGEHFGVTLDPAIRTSVDLENVCGQPFLSRIRQLSVLTNPKLIHPYMRGLFEGTMTESGNFVFALSVMAVDEIGKKDVSAHALKVYTPSLSKSGFVYRGETVGLSVFSSLPDPIRVNPPVDETELTGRGRKNAGRIEKRLPKELSEEQVRQMLGNLLEGRVFTAGVWNPLEITGSRRVSKSVKK